MDYHKHLKFVKYIFFLLLILLIAVSVFPGNLVNLILIGDASTSPSSDKFSHFISYFVLSIFAYLSFYNTQKLRKIFIFLILLSIILEVVHLIIPNRYYENLDLLMNVCGVLAVSIFFYYNKKYE